MEKLIGWRILSTIEEIRPGHSAQATALHWDSEYAIEFLMLEMMAQTGALIIGALSDFKGNVVFAKVESATYEKFQIFSGPCVVEAFAHEGVGEQGSWIEASISVENKKISSAKFFLIDAGDLDGTQKSVTFHDEFLDYYQVRNKVKS